MNDIPTADEVDRFAAAVDAAAAPDADDPELARELEIVNMLAAQGGAWDPEPEARARARARLLAAMQEESGTDGGPSRAS